MAKKKVLTAPVATDQMPKGVPYIIGNEAAERFSYYGMRCILVVFMTEYLMNSQGDLDVMEDAEARGWYHLFGSAVYALPILGSIISDAFWGKYKTILRLSVVYCLGHLVLALDETRMGLGIGLGLIAIGSGGIKPCVSAHVGDQFGEKNKHLMSKVFTWFYFSINFGSTFATLMIPILLRRYGPHVAFGLPGILMLLATFAFWQGRNVFVHVPPAGMAFVKQTFSKEGLKAIGKLTIVMVFLAPYYALFEQTGAAWVQQAKLMDLQLIPKFTLGSTEFAGVTLLPSQVHTANPILVMVLAPLFAYAVYPTVARLTKVTPLRKLSTGFFFVAASFLVCVHVENLIAAGQQPSIWWQMLGYLIITMGEVLVSITALEFFYTQAPTKMKSVIMSIKMLAMSFGNLFASGVNFLFVDEAGKSTLKGVDYYWFFIAIMIVFAVIFVGVAHWYTPRDYIQDAAKPRKRKRKRKPKPDPEAAS